jgi:glycosyltransferase involved in cell wall biosynthesis
MKLAISIVVRTFNSSKTLSGVLGRLHLADGDELVVVDSGSSDDTLKIAERYGAKTIKCRGPFNYSRSLNVGFGAAKNEWVLSLSSHSLPQFDGLLDVFRRGVAELADNVVVVYGDCSLFKAPEPSRDPVTFATQTSSISERRAVFTGNALALYRREIWLKLPFDETLATAEDLAWFQGALARGGVAARLPQAAILYRNSASLARMFKKGWHESRYEILLLGTKQRTLSQFLREVGSFVKKFLKGMIPLPILLRLSAHAFGCYLSPKFGGFTRSPRADKEGDR